MTNGSLLVVGITFEGSVRRQSLSRQLTELCAVLDPVFETVDVRTLSWQRPVDLTAPPWCDEDATTEAFRRETFQWMLDGLRERAGVAPRHSALRRWLGGWKGRLRAREPVAATRTGTEFTWRDRQNTSKHIRAWERMLDDGYDYLLVLEDDAVLRAEDRDSLGRELDSLLRHDRSGGLHIELTGHFELTQIFPGARALVIETRDGWHRLAPMSNTACAYLLDREFSSQLLSGLLARPELRRIGTDWLINCLGLIFEPGSTARTWMRIPGPFVNTSLVDGASQLATEGGDRGHRR